MNTLEIDTILKKTSPLPFIQACDWLYIEVALTFLHIDE
jgi:hypothetical protein